MLGNAAVSGALCQTLKFSWLILGQNRLENKTGVFAKRWKSLMTQAEIKTRRGWAPLFSRGHMFLCKMEVIKDQFGREVVWLSSVERLALLSHTKRLVTHSFEIHENFTFTLVHFLENCDSAGKLPTNLISTVTSLGFIQLPPQKILF